jgi:hypothetical protein
MNKLIVLLLVVATAACGDDGPTPAGPDAPDPQPDGDVVDERVYKQVEHLARPGIAEALLITNDFLNGYNATAPSFAGVPSEVLNAVVGEAKTVLKALYLGVCLTNGIAGLSAQQGLKPAGITCHAVGPAIFEADGETHTAASIAASNTYADAVFALFVPDVMRVDTAAAASTYLDPCQLPPPPGSPLLCGGRFLRDDTIDITYDFLLNGGLTTDNVATNAGLAAQVGALVSDGVSFDNANLGRNVNQNLQGDPTNRNQGHPDVSNAFPYSAAPL